MSTQTYNHNTFTACTEGFDLTSEHSASSYGQPVMVIGGVAYGRNDIVPSLFGDEAAVEKAKRERPALAQTLDINKKRLATWDGSLPWSLDEQADGIALHTAHLALLDKFIGA